MSLFKQIRDKVDASIEPSLEALVQYDYDEEMDSIVEDACEAAGVPVNEKGMNPKHFEKLSEEEIQALMDAGAEDEDVDDGFDQEDPEELLAELPEAMYAFVDPTSDLNADDEADIADDFDDDYDD